jgi:DNA adenine methylase
MQELSSPLRYPGGKSRALGKIASHIPLDFLEYREPFLGGGSVFIRMKQLHPNAVFRIGDLDYDLYCFWKTLRNRPTALVKEVRRVRKTHTNGRALYSKLVTCGGKAGEFQRAVRFYVLNRITYSGTVDSGGYSSQAFDKRFTSSNIDTLEALSGQLKNVEIRNASYEDLLFEKGKKVFIYLDPPYWTSRNSKLYGKNGSLHASFDHVKFARDVRKCKHRWLITYDDSDLIRDLYGFAHIYPWEMQYGMNNVSGRKPAKGKEVLITNYPCEVGV